jgi:hypothetical protein
MFTKEQFPISMLAFGGTAGAIAGCTSIDAYPRDNGFLPCARAHNPRASGHGSTAEAIASLMRCIGAGTGTASLVGHGEAGIIGTGIGDGSVPGSVTPDKLISTRNRSYWEPYVRQLRGHATSLTLWACHPGAEDAGADFLYMLAGIINANVAGPTGFLYCSVQQSELWIEPGSVWQVATPSHRPNPIKRPTLRLLDIPMEMVLNETPEKRVPLDDILSVEFRPGFMAHTGFRLMDADARDFLRLAQWDQPYQPGGVPAAMVSGILVVTFASAGRQETREFALYNHLLLEDLAARGTFYRCSDGFQSALMSLK